MPERHHRELVPPPKLEGEPLPSRTSLRSSPTPETLLGELTVPCHPHRTKPHQEMDSIAAAPLAPVRSTMVPPCQPIRAATALSSAVSRPFHRMWPGLDQGYPVIYIKSWP
jgi:hypothetical protein